MTSATTAATNAQTTPHSVLVRFILRKFDQLTDLTAQMDDDAANAAMQSAGSNSVVQLLVHCCGMLRRWSSSVNLGIDVPRDRDAEFEAHMPVREVLERAAQTRSDFLADLQQTNPAAKPLAVPPGREDFWAGTCEGVLLHVFEELCQHLGQAEITRDALLCGS